MATYLDNQNVCIMFWGSENVHLRPSNSTYSFNLLHSLSVPLTRLSRIRRVLEKIGIKQRGMRHGRKQENVLDRSDVYGSKHNSLKRKSYDISHMESRIIDSARYMI